MGRLSRGYLGGFQGQLGTAYGCFWRLMDLIKAMPRKVKRPATEAQLPARLKMALITSFLGRLSHIIDIGFKNVAGPGQSAMNAAVSYNLNNAVTGTSPNYTIDFPNLMVTKGKLAQPYLMELAVDTPAEITFKWKETTSDSNGKPTDKAIFFVFNPTKGQSVSLTGVVTRSTLEYALSIPLDFSGDTVQCYMSFVSADGKLVSDSLYIGGIQTL
ncbi:DUF6266 family protein [Pedobacter nyackensis]|uniref:DUF6266 family protein n=1 Tax=Pedobacter nyackensis TaxID=475255 RepID=UPI00292F4021|nr:DUF6266 family protein [Pedobacter nyackensis]